MNRNLIPILILALFFPFVLSAETIILKNKSVVKGTILSFYEDKFVVSLEGGGKEIIQKKNIDKIVFERPDKETQRTSSEKDRRSTSISKPSPQFSSPIKTFLYWEKAARKGNHEKMAECFIFEAQDDQLAQLKSFSKEKMKKMRKETKKTDFHLAKPLIDGDKAYLSVTRKMGKQQRTEIIQFQKEGENWKMLPE